MDSSENQLPEAYRIQAKAVVESLPILPMNPSAINAIATISQNYIDNVVNLANKICMFKCTKKIKVRDINEVLSINGEEPLLGYTSNVQPYHKIGVAPAENPDESTAIWISDEPTITIDSILNTPLDDYPIELNFNFFWLAHDGEQPQIAENEISNKIDDLNHISSSIPPQMKSTEQTVVTVSTNTNIPDKLQKLFFDIDEEVNKFNGNIQNCKYLGLLSMDASLQPLIPYFLRHFTRSIQQGNKYCIHFVRALFSNPHLNFQPYILNFLTIAMSVLFSPFQDNIPISADFLSEIISKGQENSPLLANKVLDQLSTILFDSRIDLNMKYGAALGLQSFPPEILKVIILPNLSKILINLKKIMNNSEENYQSRLLAIKFYGVLKQIVENCYYNDIHNHINLSLQKLDEKSSQLYNELIPFFGNDYLSSLN